MTTKETTSFVYVTYIRSTPQKVFEAIIKPERRNRSLRRPCDRPLLLSGEPRLLPSRSPSPTHQAGI